jgi:hypothetical protein
MTDLPQSPSGASVTVITAQKIFAWTFDFEFLMQKANHELELSMSEGRDLFFANAMNFAVTIHAISDYLWHVKAIHDGQWANKQNKFVEWIKTQNDCIAVFIDIFNTYNHTVRREINMFADRLGLYHEDSVRHSPLLEDLKNRIFQNGSSGDVFWPVLTTITGRLIYYRYAAEYALHWWRVYHGT